MHIKKIAGVFVVDSGEKASLRLEVEQKENHYACEVP